MSAAASAPAAAVAASFLKSVLQECESPGAWPGLGRVGQETGRSKAARQVAGPTIASAASGQPFAVESSWNGRHTSAERGPYAPSGIRSQPRSRIRACHAYTSEPVVIGG